MLKKPLPMSLVFSYIRYINGLIDIHCYITSAQNIKSIENCLSACDHHYFVQYDDKLHEYLYQYLEVDAEIKCREQIFLLCYSLSWDEQMKYILSTSQECAHKFWQARQLFIRPDELDRSIVCNFFSMCDDIKPVNLNSEDYSVVMLPNTPQPLSYEQYHNIKRVKVKYFPS